MSKKLSSVSPQAESLWFRCLPFTDDAGRMIADIHELRATVIPLGRRGKPVPVSVMSKCLNELASTGLIELYSVNGNSYLQFEKWSDFQTLKGDRKPNINCPAPDGTPWNPLEPSEGKGREGKGREGKAPIGATYTPDFESFWKEAPKKVSKRVTFQRWNERLGEGVTPATLTVAMRNYAADCEANDSFPKHPATFIGPGYHYEDYTSGIPQTRKKETEEIPLDEYGKPLPKVGDKSMTQREFDDLLKDNKIIHTGKGWKYRAAEILEIEGE